MNKTFLSNRRHVYSIIFLLLIFYISSLSIFLFCLMAYLIICLIFRKNKDLLKEAVDLNQDVFLSPVNGRVLSLRSNVFHKNFGKNLQEIRVAIGWWNECGIYLPKKAEVKDLLVKNGKRRFRYLWGENLNSEENDYSSTTIKFSTSKNEIFGIHFLSCILGAFPRLYILPGDRGARLANIGYFPLGGSVIFYIPENYEILIQVGQEIKSGQTLIAGNIEEAETEE